MQSVEDVEELFDDLMNLIVQFGNLGVVHSDFNEFNIMISDEGKPVIIDFPQMISTSHPDAKLYFDRDVSCIREFFRRRFDFESSTSPSFDDVRWVFEACQALPILSYFRNFNYFFYRRREDTLDVEVSASGFTKEMELDLMCDTESSASEEESYEDCPEEFENPPEEFPVPPEEFKKEIDEPASEVGGDVIEKIDDLPEKEMKDFPSDEMSENETEAFKYTPSFRSYSTASTIAPEVVRAKVKKAINRREKTEERKRLVAKGEASATTRSRRENRAVISECDGIWGWE